MPLKYASTVDRNKVALNIADLQRQGWPRNIAIVECMNAARAAWFKQHPKGALPLWMAYPKEYRGKHHYTPNGAPKSEKEAFRASIALQRNPANRKTVAQGRALLESFTGHAAKTVRTVKVADSGVGVDIGKVIGIIYETTRDGVRENYIHKFKVSCRPHLVVSSDGKQFRSLGGDFRFTERGFVDKS